MIINVVTGAKNTGYNLHYRKKRQKHLHLIRCDEMIGVDHHDLHFLTIREKPGIPVGFLALRILTTP
jgi:hypothetical protein